MYGEPLIMINPDENRSVAQEILNVNLNDYLLFQCTNLSMNLINPGIDINQPSNNMHLESCFIPNTNFNHSRFSLVEYIPHL